MRPVFTTAAALPVMLALLTGCDAGKEPSVAEEAAAAAVRGVDRARSERTMNRLETLRTALDRFSIDHGSYPAASSLSQITAELVPVYVPRIDIQDAWGHSMTYSSDGSTYTVISPGGDGRAGTADDVVLSDGVITGGR